MSNYENVIGLEIHVRIKSKTKMFCNCKNSVELESEANVNICPVCSGFPGMLPKLNEEVVKLGVKAGLLMNCSINNISRFDRKSYFYPDLPNAFQTTQLYEPITGNGSVKTIVNGEIREFKIHHMHLENDAGKLSHISGKSLVDLNRAGSPLMEIVTDPVFSNKEEVMEFLKELQKLLRSGEVSDADMEKGQLRCDVNISTRNPGEPLGTKVELKNINSFSSIGRAIDSETKRQVKILESGQKIDQETRGWDDDKGISSSQRSKEDAMDYRYFPEPDLLPLHITEEFISELKSSLPEFPIDKRIRYLKDFGLSEDDARILTASKDLSDYFDELVKLTNDPKKSCSYLTTVLLAFFKEDSSVSIKDLKFDISEFAKLISLLNSDEISSTNSKEVLGELFENGGKTDEIIDRKGFRQKNDTEFLEKVVDEVIAGNSEQVNDYKSGNERVFGFLVGQCMKASKGQGNPKIFNEILKKKLG